MKNSMTKIAATMLLCLAALACTKSSSPSTTPPTTTTASTPASTAGSKSLRIKLTHVYVDDLDKALRFYTDVLGFEKKADVSKGGYRWLTVGSPDEADGTQLQLALDDNPAAKAYQQAMLEQGQPAAMFYTDDVDAEYERIKARGAELTMPPTDVTMSRIAMLKDGCGNLIQITQLKH